MNAARLLAVAALLAAPALSFAAAPQALTRADVRADLVRVERAGYQPISGDAQYPADLEAALVQVRSDQNGASLSQADGEADADRAAPAARRPAAKHAARQAHAAQAGDAIPGFGDVYAHS
ncbi:DUF4148 domain-containing protein [Burkholderia sp. 22PA0106]|uniref:DUF4148 domain-containing protein n=1 Tax=Burkholderia sp. 22PA0106 TaxID=3237371 RepID=UPI0039C009AA